MTTSPQDLKQQGQALYSRGVNQALAGFQLIEEMLKTYIEMHFDFIRLLVNGRAHFEFRREDYQEAALGRLTQVFSKLCSNGQLISDLRAVAKRRDFIAHRALLKLYDAQISPVEYTELMDELREDMDRNSKLMKGILEETSKIHSSAPSP